MFRKYNWFKIQEYYNDSHTLIECQEVFGFSGNAAWKASLRGEFKTRDKKEQQLSRFRRRAIFTEDIGREIARLYIDEGLSSRDIIAKDFVMRQYKESIRLGYFVPRTKSEAIRNKNKIKGPNIPGPEACERLSKRQSENNSGGRCKWFVVAGKKVQGTWERNLALVFEEMNIRWERCKPWTYILDGKTRRYTPDFYLSDYDLYIEVKGYYWRNDREKMDAVIEQYPEKRIQIIEKELYEGII